jgi:putative hydrolase of HD superfamily
MADPISVPDLAGRLAFIHEAERLKDTLRSAHSSSGRRESTAEHTWRLCLLAMTMQDLLGPLDFERVLKLCVVHDLGEAISGDVPATMQTSGPDKSERERRDLIELSKTLPAALQAELLALWEEYEHAASFEARVVKALDKIETIVQHNQGANPPGFDHTFNLGYGRQQAGVHPAIAALRELVDEQTRRNAGLADATDQR